MALLQRRLPSHRSSPRRAPRSGHDTCWIRAHAGRPHRLRRPTPSPLGQSVIWQALHAGGFLGPPPAGTTASLSLAPRPASPCQRDAASEPARQSSTEAAASAAKASDAVGEPLGASRRRAAARFPTEVATLGAGATVACLTPDQKAGSSEPLGLHCSRVIAHLPLCRLPSLLPRKTARQHSGHNSVGRASDCRFTR
jgi:hypothetical protein